MEAFFVAMCSRKDAIHIIMFLKSTQPRITDTIEMKEHFLADWDRLVLVIASGASSSFSSNVLVPGLILRSRFTSGDIA